MPLHEPVDRHDGTRWVSLCSCGAALPCPLAPKPFVEVVRRGRGEGLVPSPFFLALR